MPWMKHANKALRIMGALLHNSLVRPLILVCAVALFGVMLLMRSGPAPKASAWFNYNLFQNADFETGTMAPGWTQSAGPAGDVTVMEGNNRSPDGRFNAILRGDISTTVELKQRVDGLTPGQTLYLGAFVRQTATTGDPLGFGNNSAGYTNCGGFNYVQPPKWELLSCVGQVPATFTYLAPKMSYRENAPNFAATDDWYLAAPPNATTSIYVGSVAYGDLYNFGFTEGTKHPQGSIVVLDFGFPSSYNGVQGAKIYGPGTRPFQSTAQIQGAVQGYLDGFWAGTGVQSAQLKVAVGVNNASIGGVNGVTAAHATAWAGMVNNLQNYIDTHGYGNLLSIAGAMDIEQDPAQGYQSFATTKAWVDAWGNATWLPYYDFGSCTGCPTTQNPNPGLPGGWTTDNVYYVAWGAPPAYPLPEIYAQSGVNADQWYTLALNHSPMTIIGAFTQYEACNQTEARGKYCYGSNPPVDGTKNHPGMGWGQLSQYMNFNSRTNEWPIMSTDIKWQYP